VTTEHRWQVAPPAPPAYVEQLRDLSPTLAQILYNRGYHEPDAARRFLEGRIQDDSPFRLKGIHRAVDRLRRAIKTGESVVVYGDFDADGVTATALMTQALHKLGANVRPYIPHRVDEGYGLNSESLKALADQGAQLVVTVDCGIRSVQEVAYANSFGLEMIISDHHSIGPELPPALAVINPRQTDCEYPEKRLAGVGVAYKLAQALHRVEQQQPLGKGDATWTTDHLLDLVAIGTVADLVPLVGENRSLVQRGLALLNEPQREGLVALYKAAGVQAGRVSAMTIGFALGPRINAAGRLEHADLAYDLLTAENLAEASEKARELHRINHERQQYTADEVALAEELVGVEDLGSLPLIFVAHEEFKPGIVGLVASRLTDAAYRPAVVVELGEEVGHGSCRSISEFNITAALDQCAELLVRHGGHAMAAGFTVRVENVDALSERLMTIAADQLTGQELMPTLSIDAELPLSGLTFELLQTLDRLEPTGQENPQPLFMSPNVRVKSHQVVGEDGRHLKLKLGLDSDGMKWDAIAFRQGHRAADLPEQIDVAYHFERNEFRGMVGLQLNVQDIRPATGVG
jgi:single-stranded-DNA-specific exonuclease